MGAPWVCLMYHDITSGPSGSGGGPARFAVPFDEFRRQLDQLRAEGYEGRSLRAALQEPRGRFVAITFDDGDAGQYERGYRALAERGMTATFFVITDRIGTAGYVSWGQLREMHAAGMDVQSHAKSHPFLSELAAAELLVELRGAKDALDGGLEQDTDMLALPGGDWPRRSLRPLIAAAGYRVVATSRWGLNHSPAAEANALVRVRRCTVRGRTGPATFRRIAAGDQWLGWRRRVQETALGALRTAVGPSRYAAWRRVLLDAFDGRAQNG
jgi:peptidoglycan/xylan/chitin deacetylase (PgdA/CDA1 family)